MRRKLLICAATVALGAACAGCGCGSALYTLAELAKSAVSDEPYVSYEEKIYLETVEAFLEASEAGDKKAIRKLFSKNARKSDEDLDRQIDLWLEEYPGGGYFWYRDAVLHGSYSRRSGKRSSTVDDTVVFTTGGDYYWCSIELTYENDFDRGEIGVNSASLFSKEYYCALRYEQEGAEWPREQGMNVRLEFPCEGQIRVADGQPVLYTSVERELDEAKVKAFLDENDSYDAFAERFGQPNGENIYLYYELPAEDGRPRFLKIGVDDRDNTVYSASVTDDLKWLYSLWYEED